MCKVTTKKVKKIAKKKTEEKVAPVEKPVDVEPETEPKKVKAKKDKKQQDESPVKKEKKSKSSKGSKKEKNKELEGESTAAIKRAKVDDEEAAAEPEEAKPTALTADEFYKKHDIKLWNADQFSPFQSFDDIKSYIDVPMMKQFTKAGFSTPSCIQSVCWPAALSGRDLIAVAKTGSGKTLGFLVPAYSMFMKDLPSDPRQPRIQYGAPPLGIVLAPTRELAVQIHDEAKKFGNNSRMVSVAVFGGVPSGQQIRELRKGCHLVVATPGRIKDLLALDNPPVTNLNCIKYAVLDEADQMLDMGFEPIITELMGMLPEKHQTLMFTATWPKAIQKIAHKFLSNPVHVQVGGEGLKANADVKQQIIAVSEYEKEAKLVEVLSAIEGTDSILVFSNRKNACEQISRTVKRSGMTSMTIHGDMDQSERMHALKLFRSEKVRVIVATDVAARGLDISGVGTVVNYDFPPSGCEVWVHRVGRTGRAGRKGNAITFYDPTGPERKWAGDLQKLLRNSKVEIPSWLPNLSRSSDRENARKDVKRSFFQGKGGGKKGGKGRKGGKGSRW
eukprot:TRINITY_DN710_c3_g1_i1.p1 TRINITY_DN710_c3_g1~~TRINITY_DN710_c3_g1_i1.p1  ORF type:complete len:583 (+),score=158.65 TRINITY_DN710_c3_g1_i1:73-1749(+)